jgi:hypothetical protein
MTLCPRNHAPRAGKVWGPVFVSLRRDKSGKTTAHLVSCPDSAEGIKSNHTFSVWSKNTLSPSHIGNKNGFHLKRKMSVFSAEIKATSSNNHTADNNCRSVFFDFRGNFKTPPNYFSDCSLAKFCSLSLKY